MSAVSIFAVLVAFCPLHFIFAATIFIVLGGRRLSTRLFASLGSIVLQWIITSGLLMLDLSIASRLVPAFSGGLVMLAGIAVFLYARKKFSIYSGFPPPKEERLLVMKWFEKDISQRNQQPIYKRTMLLVIGATSMITFLISLGLSRVIQARLNSDFVTIDTGFGGVAGLFIGLIIYTLVRYWTSFDLGWREALFLGMSLGISFFLGWMVTKINADFQSLTLSTIYSGCIGGMMGHGVIVSRVLISAWLYSKKAKNVGANN